MIVQQTGGTLELESGEIVSTAVVEIQDFTALLEFGSIHSTMQVWRSIEAKNSGKKSMGIVKGGIVHNRLNYQVPTADLAQIAVDGDYRIIGQNHPLRIKEALQALTGVAVANWNLTEL